MRLSQDGQQILSDFVFFRTFLCAIVHNEIDPKVVKDAFKQIHGQTTQPVGVCDHDLVNGLVKHQAQKSLESWALEIKARAHVRENVCVAGVCGSKAVQLFIKLVVLMRKTHACVKGRSFSNVECLGRREIHGAPV